MSTCITDYLSDIKDPRIDRKKLYSLTDILTLSICAMLSGADSFNSIAEFGRNKEAWLKSFLSLPNGIPSHDCIRYVLMRLPPAALQSAFIAWVNSIRKDIPEIVAIDGKTAKGSQDKQHGLAGLHMVSAWGASNQLVLGQIHSDEKSNEITAIPALLKLLKIKGCLVTIDAMGCQLSIAEQIIEQKADYVFGLKGNQGLLHKGVIQYFDELKDSDDNSQSMHTYTETETSHGRTDVRHYSLTHAPKTLHRAEEWCGLTTIGKVTRHSTVNGKVSEETRYFISSMACDVEQFAHAVRSHWGIENKLHWCIDVVFREDDSRIRSGHAPAHMSMFRHTCLNLLKQESSKMSIKQKKLKAAWNDEFRAKVLFG